jgi:hypothetical protein
MHYYRKRVIYALFALLTLFFIIFSLALFNLNRGNSVLNIGLDYALENWIVITLSVIAIFKVVIAIIKG